MTVFYVYETKNLINGKIYVGKHTAKTYENDYLGSGKLLHEAINKYGKENFVKTILYKCASSEEAGEIEKSIVTQEFVDDDQTYNLTLGGIGTWYHIYTNPISNAKRIESSRSACRKPEHRKLLSQIAKKFFLEGKMLQLDWTGKSHKEETKQKIGAANSLHQKGEKNSMYGKVWISNFTLKKSIFVSKEEAEILLATNEWIKGRKVKW